MEPDLLVDVWRQAAEDLGIAVRAPYVLARSPAGDAIECIALVEDFGSPNGTIVLARHRAPESARSLARDRGRFVSLIDEVSYSSYNRALFVETLNDWGWFGQLDRVPVWYTGEK